MYPYIALLWDPQDGAACESARRLQARLGAASPSWESALDIPGISVYHQAHRRRGPESVYPLHANRGVALGRIFDSANDSSDRRASQSTLYTDQLLAPAAFIVESGGQALINRYWGRYIAFFSNDEGSERSVLRDPTGGVACYRACHSGVAIYFMRFEDLELLSPQRRELNLHFVLGYLASNVTYSRETGLEGVECVRPGERITHSGSARQHTFLWDPVKIALESVSTDDDFEAAVGAMRAVTRRCVHAWASGYDRIGISLSGGLDSSIVLACLATAPHKPQLLGWNFHYLAGASGDERAYARAAALHFGIELVEACLSCGFSLEHGRRLPRAQFPTAWVDDIEGTQSHIGLLQARDIGVEFSGIGGDEIFYRGSIYPSAVDYARRNPLSPSLLRVAMDDAIVDGVSLWKVLSAVWTFGIRRKKGRTDLASLGLGVLMRPEAVERLQDDVAFRHPLFLENAEALPPAKYEQAYVMVCGLDRHYIPKVVPSDIATLSPLKSQPLIELSLRTPTYTLRSGGVDRSVARKAFSQDLPRKIVGRKSKLFSNRRLETALANNLPLARELLLDGVLVREGILDRAKIETVLSGDVNTLQSGILEICSYLNVEAWALQWRNPGTRAAA